MKLLFFDGVLDADINEIKNLSFLFQKDENDEELTEFIIPDKFSKNSFIKLIEIHSSNNIVFNDEIYEITELANYLNDKIIIKLCTVIKKHISLFMIGKKLIEFIEKYIDKPWNWKSISMNPNITIDIIEKYPNKPWDWEYISRNPNITMEFIEKYIDKPLNWKSISYHNKITLEFLHKYIDKLWDWKTISQKSSTTMEFIEKHLDKPWDWKYISNPMVYRGIFL